MLSLKSFFFATEKPYIETMERTALPLGIMKQIKLHKSNVALCY